MTNRLSSTHASTHPSIVEKELSYRIVGCFFSVYNELGYGFSESVYAKALVVALQQLGIHVEREVPITVVFRGVDVGTYRIDMLVERRIIIEIKSTERIADGVKRQIRNYLSAAQLELGLILHFGPKAEYHRILHARKLEQPAAYSANSEDSDASL